LERYPWGPIRRAVNVSVPGGQSHLHWRTALGLAIPHYLLTRIQDRHGRVVNLTWTSGAEPRVTAVKDAGNTGVTLAYTGDLVTSVTDPMGRVHTLSYSLIGDGGGGNWQRLTTVTAKGFGSPTRTTQTWSFAYHDPNYLPNGYGNWRYTGDLVIQRTTPDGLVTSYNHEPISSWFRYYDEDFEGRMWEISWIDSSEGSPITKKVVRTRSGNSGTVQYPSEPYRFTYSDAGDRTSVETTASSPVRTWSWTYDGKHNVTSYRSPLEQGTTYPLVQYDYLFDGAGRIDQITARSRQADGSLGDPKEIQFNDLNLPSQIKEYARAGSGNVDQITRYTYDGGGPLTVGNPTAITHGYGTAQAISTSIFYEGNDGSWGLPTRVRNEVGADVTIDYHDKRGWRLSAASPENLVVGPTHPDRPGSVVSTAYNGDGLPSQVTDAEGHAVGISYNAQAAGSANLVITHTYGDGSTRQAIVDPMGAVLEAKDERGVRTLFTYNPQGQVKSVCRAAGTADERLTTLHYDTRGDLSAIDPPAESGTRIQFSYVRHNPDGTPTSVYEGGRVTKIAYAGGAEEVIGYNSALEPAWRRQPGGGVVNFTRDSHHRVCQVSHPANGGYAAFSTTQQFDEFGRPTTSTDSAGTTTRAYDVLDRPLAITPPNPQKAVGRGGSRTAPTPPTRR
jgi:YD repeat-containing protein